LAGPQAQSEALAFLAARPILERVFHRKESPMPSIVFYATRVCPYCVQAERLLRSKGVERIEKTMVDKDPALREEMIARTGRRTVPQIFIGARHVGGFDDLQALSRTGELDALLGAA
jgi:glutaredoxin 3